MAQKILIYDLETTSVDRNVAIPRIMGFESSEVEGFCYTTNIAEMVKIIDSHDVIVGYNNKEYDDFIMSRYGASFYGKVVVDLMEIIHGKSFGNGVGRKSVMSYKGKFLKDILHNKKLDTVCQILDGPPELGVDYNLFKKPFFELEPHEKERCLEYLKRDIEMTKHVYIFTENFFSNFRDGGVHIDGVYKPFLTQEQIRKKYYITSSLAALVYKLLCNLTDLPEEYSNDERVPYDGGFVADPTVEFDSGNIYALDFSSLYPHIMIQHNLFSRTADGYDTKTLHPVSNVLKQLYKQRLEFKKNGDTKEYAIKIVINTIYGLLGNPSFKSISDFKAAEDCTRYGREWINMSREVFEKHGYKFLYTDTDSVYLKDPFNDKNKLLKVKDIIIKNIKDSVPFPVDTFDMTIDAEINYIAFFPNTEGGYKKKNYIYLEHSGKLTVKGLKIIKSDGSNLSKLIFHKYIKPQILDTSQSGNRHVLSKTKIQELVELELKNDISSASVFKKVKSLDAYKCETSLNAVISKQIGEGEYHLLKLKGPHKKGLGSSNNYLQVSDAADIRLSDLDISSTMSELSPFVKNVQTTLFTF